jgi:CubicO group peptidase (beta-lactamase class C family)
VPQTTFLVPQSKADRIAQTLPKDPVIGAPTEVLLDRTQAQGSDSGGAGIATTTDDYLKFYQMMLNGGRYNGRRFLSRTTVALMTSDHLGAKVATPLQPGELLMGRRAIPLVSASWCVRVRVWPTFPAQRAITAGLVTVAPSSGLIPRKP